MACLISPSDLKLGFGISSCFCGICSINFQGCLEDSNVLAYFVTILYGVYSRVLTAIRDFARQWGKIGHIAEFDHTVPFSVSKPTMPCRLAGGSLIVHPYILHCWDVLLSRMTGSYSMRSASPVHPSRTASFVLVEHAVLLRFGSRGLMGTALKCRI